MIADYKVKVLEKNQLTSHVIEVMCETGGMEWEVGQYVSAVVSCQLLVVGGQSQTIRRSYSLSTLPNSGKLGFVVDTKPMGSGSQYFINLKVGDEMEFKGPLGKFTLNQQPTANNQQLVFVATGTGIGPLRAMIDALLTQEDQRSKIKDLKIKLYFGLRTQADIFWQDWLEETKRNYPEIFDYKLVLSKPEAGWTGLTGHVTEYVLEGLEGQGGLENTPSVNFYLCGNMGMIIEVNSKLKEKGIPKEDIHFESYYGD